MAGKNKSNTRIQTGLNEPKNMPSGKGKRRKSAGADKKNSNSGRKSKGGKRGY